MEEIKVSDKYHGLSQEEKTHCLRNKQQIQAAYISSQIENRLSPEPLSIVQKSAYITILKILERIEINGNPVAHDIAKATRAHLAELDVFDFFEELSPEQWEAYLNLIESVSEEWEKEEESGV